MSMRTKKRPTRRSRSALPNLLGVVALSLLAATTPVGAAGGNIDNDSPYNMPSATDSSSEGGGGSGNGGSGGGLKATAPAPLDSRGRFAPGAIRAIVPQVGVGATFQLVDSLDAGAFVRIPGSKVAAPAASGTALDSAIGLELGAGDFVKARDSAPLQGDLDVELQGSFSVGSDCQVLLHPTQSFLMATGFIVIGEKSAVAPHSFVKIDHVVPLAAITKALDVSAIATSLAAIPAFVGRDVAVLVGHKSWQPEGGVGFHLTAAADFEVGPRTTIHVDTQPKLPH